MEQKYRYWSFAVLAFLIATLLLYVGLVGNFDTMSPYERSGRGVVMLVLSAFVFMMGSYAARTDLQKHDDRMSNFLDNCSRDNSSGIPESETTPEAFGLDGAFLNQPPVEEPKPKTWEDEYRENYGVDLPRKDIVTTSTYTWQLTHRLMELANYQLKRHVQQHGSLHGFPPFTLRDLTDGVMQLCQGDDPFVPLVEFDRNRGTIQFFGPVDSRLEKPPVFATIHVGAFQGDSTTREAYIDYMLKNSGSYHYVSQFFKHRSKWYGEVLQRRGVFNHVSAVLFWDFINQLSFGEATGLFGIYKSETWSSADPWQLGYYLNNYSRDSMLFLDCVFDHTTISQLLALRDSGQLATVQ